MAEQKPLKLNRLPKTKPPRLQMLFDRTHTDFSKVVEKKRTLHVNDTQQEEYLGYAKKLTIAKKQAAFFDKRMTKIGGTAKTEIEIIQHLLKNKSALDPDKVALLEEREANLKQKELFEKGKKKVLNSGKRVLKKLKKLDAKYA